jgi:hypothetical protein
VKDTTLDLGSLTIEVPEIWKIINDDNDTLPKVADLTERYRISLPNNKLVFIQHGLGAWDRSKVPIIPTKDKAVYLNRDTSYIVFSDYPKKVNPRLINIHKIEEYQISGFRAKVYEPLKLSHGFTGVYIDSVGAIEPVGKYGFALYAEGLDSALSKRLIKAIKSIKLKRLE